MQRQEKLPPLPGPEAEGSVMPKVVLITNLPEDLVRVVLSYAPAGFETASISSQRPDEEKVSLTRDADFLILYGLRPSETLLRASPKLRHIQLLSAGYEGIDLQLTESLHIPVS